MRRYLILIGLALILLSVGLSQNQTGNTNQTDQNTASVCVNDGICTLAEYNANCLDCRLEAKPSKVVGEVKEPQSFNLALWLALGLIFLVVLVGLILVVGVIAYKRFLGKSKPKLGGSRIRLR